MKIELPKNYHLYETSYGSDIPSEQLFVLEFNAVPSKFKDKTTYDSALVDFIKHLGFVELNRVFYTNRHNRSTERLFVNKDKNMFFIVSGDDVENKKSLVTVSILYDLQNGELDTQINFTEIKKLEKKKPRANINLIKSEMGALGLEEYDLASPKINLELNYGKEFKKIHDVILKRLNKNNDSGIILLHGDPGSGKCVVGETKITLRDKKTGEIFQKNIKDLLI